MGQIIGAELGNQRYGPRNVTAPLRQPNHRRVFRIRLERHGNARRNIHRCVVVDPIRVVGHVDFDILGGVEGPVVAVAAAVDLGDTGCRNQAGTPEKETEDGRFHGVGEFASPAGYQTRI